MKKENILLKLKNLSVIEVLKRSVSEFGTGTHVIVPKKHLARKVYVVVLDEYDRGYIE